MPFETSLTFGLNGRSDRLAALRALADLTAGRVIRLTGSRPMLVLALETAPADRIGRLIHSGAARLLVAASDGCADARALALSADQADPDALRADLFAGTLVTRPGDAVDAGEAAALAALRRSALAPALVTVPAAAFPDDETVAATASDILADTAAAEVDTAQPIAHGQVPLAESADSRFTLFSSPGRTRHHLAVMVGRPDHCEPVPVRIHSACLTGDLFASLRCDCGEQLRSGIARLQALGGGLLLYLDQEGRGIGLANKLRAYTLQDDGLDTMAADAALGFSGDERSYRAVPAMLAALGVGQVRPLTSNPEKLAALADAGVALASSLPHEGPMTAENARYLTAKRARAARFDGR